MARLSVVAASACMLAAHGGLPSRALAQATNPTLEQYLRRMGIGSAQVDSAARGHAIVELLANANDRDVSVFGIVGVSGSADSVRGRALNVERLLAASGRRFHVFGNPATPADVREAAFDESEYRDLRKCRPGECGFKLPASEMDVFVQQVDWSSPNAKGQVDELMRAGMLRLVAAYRARGNAATPTYDDVRGIRSGDVFADLVRQSADLYQYAPELEQYLTAYPSGRPPSARDVLYWSEDRLPRLRPILTLNHVVLYAPPGAAAYVARKQIYASHYFEGAFELLAVVDGGASGGGPGAYLLVLRRFRFDSLPTGLMNIRGKVRQQLVEATRSDLERERSTITRTAAP